MKGLLYFMKRYDFTITSDRGLHAQPVAALASIACKSASCVTLEYDGKARKNLSKNIKILLSKNNDSKTI